MQHGLMTSFHRQAHNNNNNVKRRSVRMTSPSPSLPSSSRPVPVAVVAGMQPSGRDSLSSSPPAPLLHHFSNSPPPPSPLSSFSSSPSSSSSSSLLPSSSMLPSSPDLQSQRASLENLLDRKFVEGDFWYVVVAEWLESLKRYVGLNSCRKHYGQRGSGLNPSPPGPILTRRDYAHTVDVVHEDAWRALMKWFGLADGHKEMKLVVFHYARGPEIEHNINSFKVSMTTSVPEDFHIVRFSKMEKVGHVEFKIRQLYAIPDNVESRIWAKPDTDSDWRALFSRDKAIGIVLGIDSDFTSPVVVLETRDDSDGKWSGAPESVSTSSITNTITNTITSTITNTITNTIPMEASERCGKEKDGDDDDDDVLSSLFSSAGGDLLENSLFDDVTSNWELDVHDHIDQVGKMLMEKLHGTFDIFVQKGRDHIEEREYKIRERERLVCARETATQRLSSRLEGKELRLAESLERCEEKIKEYEIKRLELERQFVERHENLETRIQEEKDELRRQTEELEMSKEKFQKEVERMAELGKIQESRIKLDIGGSQFTTSLLTLSKDNNSMLAAMFSGRHQLKTEEDGSYFIDRDGSHFRYILNYLRDGSIKEGTFSQNDPIVGELLTEAEFYQLEDLVQFLRDKLSQRECG